MAAVPTRTLLLVLLAGLAIAGVAVTGHVSGSPPPTPVCPTCGVQLEQTAADEGHTLDVTRSEVDVQIHANGSARWTTRTTLSSQTASSLTDSAARSIVSTALEDHPVVEPTNPRVSLSSDQLRVTYRAPDVATVRTGVLLVDSFQRGIIVWWIVNADRVTIHAPSGYELGNDPGGTTVHSAVTYHGDSQDRWGNDTTLSGDTFIAFTPTGTALPGLRADIAIAAYLLPAALADLVHYGAIPTVALTAAVLLYPRLGVESAAPDIDVDHLIALTIGVVATLLGLLLVLGQVWFGINASATVLAAGFAILATTLAARYPTRTTTRGLIVAALAGLFAFAASNILVISAGRSLGQAIAPTAFAVLLALPAIAMLPLGFADTVGSPLSRYLRIALVTGPALLVATRVPIDGGMGSFFLLVILASYSVLLGVLGLLPYWIGVRIGTAAG